MDEGGDGRMDFEGWDGGTTILDANLDFSLYYYASSSRLGIYMVFDFSCFCSSLECITSTSTLGTHINFEFYFFCSMGLYSLLDISFIFLIIVFFCFDMSIRWDMLILEYMWIA